MRPEPGLAIGSRGLRPDDVPLSTSKLHMERKREGARHKNQNLILYTLYSLVFFYIKIKYLAELKKYIFKIFDRSSNFCDHVELLNDIREE